VTVALFCGSREWRDPAPIRAEVSRLEGGDVVIHGDQRGADLIAEAEAKAAGLHVLPFPADWGLGPSAGSLRNSRMLQSLLASARSLRQPVRVVAFHEDSRLGKGTRDMVRKSMTAGVRVRVFLSSEPEMVRVNGNVTCEVCKIPYWKHPDIISSVDWNGDPYLKLDCTGAGLKL
jgi:hypothetical protein